MSPFRVASVLIPVALLLAGCTSVLVTRQDAPETIVVQNAGCKLFCCLPIVSGDPDYPNMEVGSWFEDTLTLETNLRLIDHELARQGASTCKNLSSYRSEEQIVPILLKRYVLTTSAEIVR